MSHAPSTEPLRLRESRYNVRLDHDGRHYIFNGVSGDLRSLSFAERNDLDNALTNQRLDPTDVDLVARLVESHMFVPDDVDERDLLRRRFTTSRSDRTHLGLTIISSMGCNFDCPYCFETKKPAILGPDVVTEIKRLLLARAPELETLFITWYGGEPLLGSEVLLKLSEWMQALAEFYDIELQASIVTNGWFLDADMARRLVANGVTYAQVGIDGPADLHDQRRPHVNGRATFERVLANTVEASKHMNVSIRINGDAANIDRTPELMTQLAEAGLADRVLIYLGRVDAVDHNPDAPSASYEAPCYTTDEHATAQIAFNELARSYGFETAELPGPLANPCTAIRTNELIVGAKGELWKCIDDAGDQNAIVGTIFDLGNFNSRVKRWFDFDPFSDPGCLECVALPVCMGGCALYAATPSLEHLRCSAFRTNHVEQVKAAVSQSSDRSDAIRRLSAMKKVPRASTPVTLGRRS